jgi:ATP-binding protein involved in chromosome partitioning
VAWGQLDYLIVDLPPGTGDIPLTLAQEVPLDGGVIVTTPQDVALADVTRGVAMLRRLNTPILGVAVNMAGYTCPQCGTKDELFGSENASRMEREIGAPVLAEFPIEQKVRESGDAGIPIVVADPTAAQSRKYLDLAAAVESSLAKVRDELYGPEPVEVKIDDASRSVRIRWSDGSATAYSFHGLRGWCPCATCQGHSSQTKFVDVKDPRPTGHEGVGRYAIRFLWADGHSTGMYSYEWLREIADFSECRA